MPVSQDFNVAFHELQPDLILSSVESLGYQTDGRLLALNNYENRLSIPFIHPSASHLIFRALRLSIPA